MSAASDDHVAHLRAAVLALKAPAAAKTGAFKRAPAPLSSVYGRAAAAASADVRPRTSRTVLNTRFVNAETTALLTGTTMALLVLPDAGAPSPILMRTFAPLVAAKAVVLVLGTDIPRSVPTDGSGPIMLPLRDGDALATEWALLALGPTKRVAFLARQAGDEWDWMVTRDSIAVQRAGTAILDRVPFLRLRVPALED